MHIFCIVSCRYFDVFGVVVVEKGKRERDRENWDKFVDGYLDIGRLLVVVEVEVVLCPDLWSHVFVYPKLHCKGMQKRKRKRKNGSARADSAMIQMEMVTKRKRKQWKNMVAGKGNVSVHIRRATPALPARQVNTERRNPSTQVAMMDSAIAMVRCCSRSFCCSRCSRCCCKCCWRSNDVRRLTLGLVSSELGKVDVGDTGRVLMAPVTPEVTWLPCQELRPVLGVVEYEGGGCSNGVTSERQDARRASKDY